MSTLYLSKDNSELFVESDQCILLLAYLVPTLGVFHHDLWHKKTTTVLGYCTAL